MNTFDTPILLIVFKRPEVTAQLIDILRGIRPRRLYISADGPRPHVAGEVEMCRRARETASRIDWDCEVRTHFLDRNLGCKWGPLSGIDWVFSQEERAIVIEDDCHPSPDFFRFCAEMLERYRDDERVTMVAGSNFLPPRARPAHGYYFSRVGHTWGWATWRRAWRFYDAAMREWPSWRNSREMREVFPLKLDREYWRKCFDSVYEGRLADAWDFQWTFAQLLRGGLAAAPAANLVTNIGVGEIATHTAAANSGVMRPTQPLAFPLDHPPEVRRDKALDIAEARAMIRMRDPRPGPLRYLPRTGIVAAARKIWRMARGGGEESS